MLFREEILGCSMDCGTSLQINGWITSTKSKDAAQFVNLIQRDRQAAILKWGKELLYAPDSLLCSIEGSFILSYWNSEQQRGILFKSLLCKQSLYYVAHDGISWSTDPLQIISENYVDAVENNFLLIACLEDSIPTTASYYSRLNRLPAGNLAIIDRSMINRKTIDTFIPLPLKKQSIQQYAGKSRELLETHAEKCLSGYSKVGVILSGGLDSSIAVTCLQRLGIEVIGIHWSFSGIPQADETDDAEMIASHLQIPLIKIEAMDLVHKADFYNEQWDFTSPYPHPFYRLFEQTLDICVSLGISICSSGYFGDVIFGPNDPWKVTVSNVWKGVPFLDSLQWLTEYWQVPKYKNRRISHGRYSPYKHYLSQESKERLKTGEVKEYQIEQKNFRQQISHSFDNETDNVLETHLYEKKGVIPFHLFASRELMEFSFNIPLPYRMIPSGGQEYSKPIMRLIYPDLPPSLLNRNYRQIMNAYNEAYAVQNKEQILTLLGRDSFLARCNVIDPRKLIYMSEDVRKWLASASGLVRCCMVELWMQSLRRKWKKRGKRNVIPIASRSKME